MVGLVEKVILSVPSDSSCSSCLSSPNSEHSQVQSQVLARALLRHYHLLARIHLWLFGQVERQQNQRAPGITGRSRSPPKAASLASWCHRSTLDPLWRARS